MKRRKFGLLSAVSVATLSLAAGFPKRAHAFTTADADTLKSTLTPLGAERAQMQMVLYQPGRAIICRSRLVAGLTA